MTQWGGGYVTDIGYIPLYHKIEEPALAAVGALVNGVDAHVPSRDKNLHLADIGCGYGITALIAAAANPGWRVTGLDFNPAHIAAARAMARQAGLTNVSFIEADLTEFWNTPVARALPEFDAVSMHGVWSWVARPVRDGIVRLLADKLAAGGMLHISYNQATGWANEIGMQRIIRAAGQRLAGRSDAQAAAGFAVFSDLLKAEGSERLRDAARDEVMKHLQTVPQAYLAHEFMNEHWAPVMHGDVVADLAAAKLDYAGTARLVDNFPELVLSAAQREVLARFDDPVMAELFKDVCRPRRLRNDIFIRGARKISASVRDERLGALTVGLQASEATWRFTFDAGFGKAQLNEPYYRTILTRLQAGPATLGALVDLPELTGRSRNPGELVAVGVGTDQLMLLPNPGAEMDAACRRLNTVLLKWQIDAGGAETVNFAVPATGGGVTLPKLEGFLTHELITAPDATDPEHMADRLGVPQDAEQRKAFAERLESFLAQDTPLLRHLGFPLP
jgi:SAM-dependent methyltransferase